MLRKTRVCVCAVADPAKGKSRGGESPSFKSGPDAEPAEPDTAGTINGE